MASAFEQFIKILRQEKQNQYNNKTVIGGLQAYAPNWAAEAHQQARTAEQHALIEEILLVIDDYVKNDDAEKREQLAQYMFDRLTRRREALPQYAQPTPAEIPPPSAAPPKPQPMSPPPSPVAKPANQQQRGDMPPRERQRPAERRPFRQSVKADEVKPKPRRKRRERLDPQEAQHILQQLQQPLTAMRGIGDKMAEKLAHIGPRTIGELLYLFPRRYDDYTRMLPLNRLEPYQNYTVIGTIKSMTNLVGQRQRDWLKVTISDGVGTLDINFFNQLWLRRQLKVGMQLVFSGKTDLFRGQVIMNNPAWEPIDQQSLHTGGIVPIYPLTKGISARTMRRMMKGLVDEWAPKIPDFVPESVLDRTEQVDLSWALRQVHFPERQEYIAYARERLAFDELLLLQLGVMANRIEWQSQPAIPLVASDEAVAAFVDALPFELTGAQQRAIEIIRSDLATDLPMNRLLQGDVGSGKTVVAAAALMLAVLNDKQAALMAPTSILAEQHFQSISRLFSDIPGLESTRIALLTANVTGSQRQEIYAGLADGSIQIVIGTHAMIQEGVEFAALALAVIDEQHRFGVQQRGALRGKGTNPHVLVMTATPIPRTLSLTMYADLDLTLLDEMPPGRTPVQTRILNPNQRTKSYLFIEETVLKRGQQAYVIYPLIEASEKLDMDSAVEGYEFIQKEIFPRWKVGLMHGRMRPGEKEAVMEQFARGEIQVLVSTTVIEVGVDVPNATAILVENAQRFGLAQLHQLRGRVGRGDQKSYCMLIADEETPRLKALENTHDGFKLAELDWQERGAGDLLGVRQSGVGKVQMAEVMNVHLVELAQKESRAIYAEDPYLELPEHSPLAKRVAMLKDIRSDLS
jgi:ATP-dependent DNA helicase RecG